MAEIPKIVRRRKGDKKDDAETEKVVADEATTPSKEKNDSPVIEAAYAGVETDAMKRAKELLARKRKQIIDNANSSVEG